VFDPLDALVADLLEWAGPTPRAYMETMEAWRTSCPRLPVWEEANERGFIARDGASVSVTAAGREFIAKQRRSR
jgi:D-3-phosphoglycerate dehydrogenase